MDRQTRPNASLLAKTFLLLVSAAVLVGCTATVAGVATKVRASDEANVALMDTGSYPTAGGHPFGPAGDDVTLRGYLEGQRMAEYVVGPWQVDVALRQRPPVETAIQIGAIGSAHDLDRILDGPLPGIAGAHGFIAGFSSQRVSATGTPRGLLNAVLRFPDPGAASAAATEMAAANPTGPAESPHQPIPIRDHPEALATTYTLADRTMVQSFAAHGPYVLHQYAYVAKTNEILGISAENMVFDALIQQQKQIDHFVPTDPARLAELPKDPTGKVLAETLYGDGVAQPVMIGAWGSKAWLHFENDPVQAATLFGGSGVDWVTQRLATVYQARDEDSAGQLADRIADDIGKTAGAKAFGGVPGLPGARCFMRTKDFLPPTAAATWRWVVWHYKCVASADRYAYTVFSNDKKDVMQQVSAQYRMLAGK